MMNKEREKPGRIPVRFVEDDEKSGRADAPTPDEAGHESPREAEAASGGEEGEGVGAESAGGPEASGPAESAEAHGADRSPQGESNGGGRPSASAPKDSQSVASGPALAELIATRSELKRVEVVLEKLAEERQDLYDRLARRQADFENYRRRVERERAETYGRVAAEVAAQLLPVVDNLQRALDAEATFQSSESEEFRHFLRGVELIGKQLNGVLESLGVQPVPTVGHPFDPHIHEAVATEEAGEFEPDTVTAELVRGYRLGDKLIRPAMVKVAK
jgi:molecular chaperone GrpE